MKKPIYCEFEFLKQFCDAQPKPSNDPLNSDDDLQNWKTTFQFLHQSPIFIDKRPDDVIAQIAENKFLLILYKNANIHFIKAFPRLNYLNNKELSTTELNGIYFTTLAQEECRQIARAYGVFVFDLQKVLKIRQDYANRTFAIPEGEKYTSWRAINFPKNVAVSNAMVIIDQYIVQESKKENIEALLDILLPWKTKVLYQLSIYTSLFEGRTPKQKSKICARLFQFIQQKRPQLNFKLVVCEIGHLKKRFHDRVIITNNVMILCPGGFDLFQNKKSTKMTTCSLGYPFFISQEKGWNDSYYNVIAALWQVEKTSVSHEFGKDFWGSKRRDNRLIVKQ